MFKQLFGADQSPALANLQDDPSVPSALLDAIEGWRVRSIEELVIGSSQFVLRKRSVQVAPLREWLPVDVQGDHALLVLPIERLPKSPLIEHEVSVAGSPGYVVSRVNTAVQEAHYVRGVAAYEGVEADAEVSDFLRAIFAFTPQPWRRFWTWRRSRTRELREYLCDGLGYTFVKQVTSQQVAPPNALSEQQFRRLLALSSEIGEILVEALGQGPDRASSADQPLLAAPLLDVDGPLTPDVLEGRLRGLRTFAVSLVALCGGADRSVTLGMIGEFGRRYEVHVACEVPLDRPFYVQTSRLQPVRVGRRGWGRQTIALRDARTNHVSLSVQDSDVVIAKAKYKTLDGGPLNTIADGQRAESEHHSLYVSAWDRDEWARFHFRLKVAGTVKLVTGAVSLITLLAALLLLALARTGPVAAEDVAVLAVPTTVAASFLLTRERTSLARRLQVTARILGVILVAALWLTVAFLYVSGPIGDGLCQCDARDWIASRVPDWVLGGRRG